MAPLYNIGANQVIIARFHWKEPGYLGGVGEMSLPSASPNVCNNEPLYNRGQLYTQHKGNH